MDQLIERLSNLDESQQFWLSNSLLVLGTTLIRAGTLDRNDEYRIQLMADGIVSGWWANASPGARGVWNRMVARAASPFCLLSAFAGSSWLLGAIMTGSQKLQFGKTCECWGAHVCLDEDYESEE